ncbi:MAG TPA: aminotransferase class I/II-fold pyridoxal phosphate-dependent enzyme, partial [Limnochordia bacterium]
MSSPQLETVRTLQQQEETPLFSGLLAHARRRPVQFHIPGHKRGAGMAADFREFIGENALSIDLINIAPVDDLHHPQGIIKEAQELAAAAFGADQTFFSVQGTSGAIMAMILAVVGPGEKILVPRNAHKSVMTALVLTGAVPVFMQPEIDHTLGVAHGVSLSTIRATLDAHPDAAAVLVVNPTYFGVAADLKGIVDLAHSRGIPVLVDEAHGAHVHFHERLPLSAMQAGADMAATSIHKLGGSLTQSSILNLRTGLVNPQRVQVAMSMLTTTSTSYLLLASLDVARRELALRGRERLERAIALAEEARAAINRIPGLYCFGREIVGDRSSSYDFDPTKLCICVKELGVTGIEIENALREEFNIEVELSDLYNILCVVSLGDSREDVEALVRALAELSRRYHTLRPANRVRVEVAETLRLALTPRDAFFALTENVPLHAAADRIAAEFVM